MAALLTRTDQLLRSPWDRTEREEQVLLTLVGLVLLCGATYGAVMGSFGGVTGARFWQLIYSASKVPLLLLGTLCICLPSFFVLNTVAGLRSDFREVLRALLGAQATLTVLLCSFAPFTAVWYLSCSNYNAAVLFNGFVFAAASCATQLSLRRAYQPLIRRNPKHRLLGRAWLLLYLFVAMQLGWLLRPFVGEPTFVVEMFRADAWGNVYIEVLHHLRSLFLGK